jgi:hypothetical protein
VAGPHQSNSDFRIFSSDNNKTITAMSTPEGFAETCRETITLMVDTVPEGVTLTDPITPTLIRPTNLQLTVAEDGGVNIQGEVRVHTTGVFNAQLLDVELTFVDRNGKTLPNSIKAPYINRGFGLDYIFDYWKIDVDSPAGISSVFVKVRDTMFTNGGNGFEISDKVVFQQQQSCYDSSTKMLTVYGAVSTSIQNPTVDLELVDMRPRIGSIIPGLYKDTVKMTKVTNGKMYTGYDLYKGTYTYTTTDGGEFSVAAYSGGKRYADDFKMTSLYNGVSCVSIFDLLFEPEN